MAIRLEELVVYGRYIKAPGRLIEVTAIGDSIVLYKFIDNGDNDEYYSRTAQCLEMFSVASKPKKKIKLIGYMTLGSHGSMGEFREYTEGYQFLNQGLLMKVSEREIEILDD